MGFGGKVSSLVAHLALRCHPRANSRSLCSSVKAEHTPHPVSFGWIVAGKKWHFASIAATMIEIS